MGLIGVVMLLGWSILLGFTLGAGTAAVIFSLLPLALALYCLYVGYLSWYQFSPSAVQHLCISLGFASAMSASSFMLPDPDRAGDPQPWVTLVFLGLLIMIYFVCRTASERLSRWLF